MREKHKEKHTRKIAEYEERSQQRKRENVCVCESVWNEKTYAADKLTCNSKM